MYMTFLKTAYCSHAGVTGQQTMPVIASQFMMSWLVVVSSSHQGTFQQRGGHQSQMPHPYLAPGRFLTCALPHSGRGDQVGLGDASRAPESAPAVIILTSQQNCHLFSKPAPETIVDAPLQMGSHHDQVPHPCLAPGLFLACAPPHSGRGSQVGLWPRGCS